MKEITESRSFKWSVMISLVATIAYIVTWQFRPVFVILLLMVFINLIIFPVYVTVSIRSVFFGIGKRKIFKNSFLPVIINMVPISLIICGPSFNLNKNYHKYTTDLKNNNCKCQLYVESYLVASGFMATDVDALYLTDSLNFRLYVGTYDEGDGGIVTKCNKDSVIIEKYQAGYQAQQSKMIEKKSFSLKDLIKSHRFE